MMQLSNSRTIAKNTIYLYFRMMLTMLVSLFTVRVVLHSLGVVDYGIYNAIGGIVTSMSFITGVLANASQRFFSLEIAKGTLGKLSVYFSAVLTSYIIIACLIVVIVEFGGNWLLLNKMILPSNRMFAASVVLQLSLLSFVTSIVSNPFQALLIANEKMNVYAYISVFETLAKLLVAYYIYISPFDKLILYALSLLLISLGVSSFYFYFSRKHCSLPIKLSSDFTLFKEIFNYSSWTLFGSVSGVASMQGCSILLNIFSGPVANASFAIATQVSNTVMQFSSSFYTAVRSPLTKSYGIRDFSYMNKLFYFSNKALFVLTFAIIMPLFAKTDFILNLWLVNVPQYMVDFVRIMLLYSLVLSLNSPITTIVQSAGKVKLYHTVVDGFALLVLPVGYVLLKIGGAPQLLLISTVIIFSISHLLRLVILKKVINFSILEYFKIIAFPAILVSFIGFLFSFFLDIIVPSSILGNIVIMILLTLIVVVTSLFILFNKEDRIQMRRLINKQ